MSGGALMVAYENIVVSAAPVLHPFRNRIKERGIGLTPYTRAILYGDSNVRLWYHHSRKDTPPNKLVWTRSPESALTIYTVFPKFLKYLKEILRNAKENTTTTTTSVNNNNNNNNNSLALIVGSNTWDIAFGRRNGREFAIHQRGCDKLIRSLRHEFPDVDIYWWSGLDLHVHRARANKDWAAASALKYMSHSRAQHLYELQINLMKSLDVPVIDFFEASVLSAQWMPFARRTTLRRDLLSWRNEAALSPASTTTTLTTTQGSGLA